MLYKNHMKKFFLDDKTDMNFVHFTQPNFMAKVVLFT